MLRGNDRHDLELIVRDIQQNLYLAATHCYRKGYDLKAEKLDLRLSTRELVRSMTPRWHAVLHAMFGFWYAEWLLQLFRNARSLRGDDDFEPSSCFGRCRESIFNLAFFCCVSLNNKSHSDWMKKRLRNKWNQLKDIAVKQHAEWTRNPASWRWAAVEMILIKSRKLTYLNAEFTS